MRMAATHIGWDKWARRVESRLRKLNKSHPFDGILTAREYLAEATYASFQLDGLEVSKDEVASALATGRQRRIFRSRQGQRIRNHVAILREIDGWVLAGSPLDPAAFMRWYTAISSGLCPADLDEPTMSRLVRAVHRVNSPELRLPAAVQEIAALHRALLADPLVPSFNGILVRLLLRYHLGRCGLPPVLFDPAMPTASLLDEQRLVMMLMEAIETSLVLALQGD
jgi:hypothetical protein